VAFDEPGCTVGVAWDAHAGALLAAANGKALAPVFPDGLKPGPAVGTGLFPALSGCLGCRVRFNLGQCPFRHPPPEGFVSCVAAAVATEPVVRRRALLLESCF
jgi:hypothetical protein